MKVHLFPQFSGEDEGDGGVRRVVEAQLKSLPRHGVSFVDDPGDADLIACHIQTPEAYLLRFPDKPFVTHTHGLYWSDYEWEEWSYKANKNVLQAICTADVTTAPTEWVADVIRRHTSRDVRVVPHGVSAREWQPPKEHRGYVLWNKTRPDPVCDPEPVTLLARSMPDTPFVMTFGDELPNATITGRLSYAAAKEVTRHAGVYLATTRETFGIGTLEALACGIPIVGFNYGGQAEYIEHGVDGWLVEPGDVMGLADGVRWALANREDISPKARQKAMCFSWAKAAEQYRDIYREQIAKYEAAEMLPRTSIIVTSYKLGDYLSDCLDSVQKQTDQDWECIVVDDHSPDNSSEIAMTYALTDERFKVIRNEQNLYLAEARNVGIRAARGRYILPLDADDMLTPGAVLTLAEALETDRTLSVAYGSVLFVNEDGRTPTDYRIGGQQPGHSGWPAPFDAWKQAEGMNFLSYSSMYRKSAWEQTGGYRRRLKTAEDADFWTRLTSYGYRIAMATTSDTLVYRNREGSMSRTQDAKRYDYLRWFPWAADRELAPAGLAGVRSVALTTPHVSIVIPVGPGHERLVQDAVDSCAAQSYQYWEAIVVNDSGVSLELPAWAKVIETDVRDAGAARNIGIAQAKGEFFLPLDADDFLQPDALQWLLSAYVEGANEPGAKLIVYSDFYEDPDQAGVFKPYALPNWTCEHLTQRGTVHAVTALTPVSVWRQVGGYAERQNWEDWDFQMRCAEAGICSIRVPSPLFTYRKFTGQRRDWANADEFAQRRDTILARWSDYFDGRKQFMGCGCAGQQASIPVLTVTQQQQVNQSRQEFGDALLVEYTGTKGGSIRYKGVSGAIYDFAAGDPPRWVAGEDIPMFASRQDFRVLRGSSPESTMADPVLTA